MSKHTAGIWNIHPSSVDAKPYIVDTHDGEPWIAFSQWIGNDKNNIIASVEMSTAQGGHGWVRSVEEAKANAQLISAAPDLLEALKDAVQVMEPFMQNDGYIAVRVGLARAAIDKAEGKA